ncbi:carbonic anhydrase [Adlercreutzia equolifaciens]|nr:carbonic anhydrase [Adlercreutzia equolifaciens]
MGDGVSEDKATTLTGADYTADDYDGDAHVPADAALRRLVEGNRIYVEALDHERDLSQERIADLFENGQRPFACVITCADSRVVPEHIFMTGLGELFVIRVAGNVVGPIELASAVYACEHLHTRLLLVLGHTHCGAIKAALDGEAGPVAAITERIAAALGDVRDPYEASVANARAAAAELSASPELARLAAEHDLDIRVAIYHTHCGVVDFL